MSDVLTLLGVGIGASVWSLFCVALGWAMAETDTDGDSE